MDGCAAGDPAGKKHILFWVGAARARGARFKVALTTCVGLVRAVTAHTDVKHPALAERPPCESTEICRVVFKGTTAPATLTQCNDVLIIFHLGRGDKRNTVITTQLERLSVVVRIHL